MMQHGIEDDLVVLKLTNNENVFTCLEHAVDMYDIRSGIIISGIGMIKDFELGYFDPEGYKTKDFPEPHELLSMNGSIAFVKDEDPKERLIPHVHCSVADREHHCWGGHLHGASVNIINEITILRLTKLNLTRIKNKTTGLYELDIVEP